MLTKLLALTIFVGMLLAPESKAESITYSYVGPEFIRPTSLPDPYQAGDHIEGFVTIDDIFLDLNGNGYLVATEFEEGVPHTAPPWLLDLSFTDGVNTFSFDDIASLDYWSVSLVFDSTNVVAWNIHFGYDNVESTSGIHTQCGVPWLFPDDTRYSCDSPQAIAIDSGEVGLGWADPGIPASAYSKDSEDKGASWRQAPVGTTGPVDLSGTINTTDGQDICAMVLASGQFMFSCNLMGVFSLNDLPLEQDGTTKRQIYADGFFPKIDTLTGSTDDAVVMTRSGTCPSYNAPYDPGFFPNSAGKRINISGNVLTQNSQTPICAMVLVNGQKTFSCDGKGSYVLNIPLDNNGQFKLQVYADGFAPMTQTYDEYKTTNNVRMARASECANTDFNLVNRFPRVQDRLDFYEGLIIRNPSTSELKEAFLDYASQQSNAINNDLSNPQADFCYGGIMQTAKQQQGIDIWQENLRILAGNILRASVGLVNTGVPFFDIAIQTVGEGLASVIEGENVPLSVTLKAAEETTGFILAKNTDLWFSGAYNDLAWAFTEDGIEDTLLREDILQWKLSGNNYDIFDANKTLFDATSINARLYYNPYNHYTTAMIGATCEDRNGFIEDRAYIITYEVEKDIFGNAVVVDDTVKVRSYQ